MVIWAILLGVVFMSIEFIMPGIGFFALASLVSFLVAIYYGMGATPLATGIVTTLLIIGATGFFLIIKNLPKSKWGRYVSNSVEATAENGYVSNASRDELLGAVGVAITVLRPAGTVRFGNRFVDVVSEGFFLEKGTEVKVVSVEGGRVIVRRND